MASGTNHQSLEIHVNRLVVTYHNTFTLRLNNKSITGNKLRRKITGNGSLRRIETIGQWLHKVAFGEVSVVRNTSRWRVMGSGYKYFNQRPASSWLFVISSLLEAYIALSE